MFSAFQCLGCDRLTPSPKQLFCVRCQRELRCLLNDRSVCVRYHRDLPVLRMGQYSGLWARWIKKLKRRSRGYVDSSEREFLEQLVEYYCREDFIASAGAVVAVPSHPVRTLFETDLGTLLAAEVSKIQKIPALPLLRISKTWLCASHSSQKDRKTAEERWQLLKEKKFKLRRDCSAQKIVLVDDVCTSGATLLLARKTLAERGIEVTGAVVLAAV